MKASRPFKGLANWAQETGLVLLEEMVEKGLRILKENKVQYQQLY